MPHPASLLVWGHRLEKGRVLARSVQQWRGMIGAPTGDLALVIAFDPALISRGRWHWQLDGAPTPAAGDCLNLEATVAAAEAALRRLGVAVGSA